MIELHETGCRRVEVTAVGLVSLKIPNTSIFAESATTEAYSAYLRVLSFRVQRQAPSLHNVNSISSFRF